MKQKNNKPFCFLCLFALFFMFSFWYQGLNLQKELAQQKQETETLLIKKGEEYQKVALRVFYQDKEIEKLKEENRQLKEQLKQK